jgi:hypothetical protein
MRGDHPDGSFSAAELARLEAEGIIEIIQPGTPEAAELDRAMAAQVDAHNAVMLETEGPDALTTDRAFRMEAIAAEQDPEMVAYAFAAWCQRRGWERSDLADWLGVSADRLAALALHDRPMDAGTELARRFGADAGRRAAVLASR